MGDSEDIKWITTWKNPGGRVVNVKIHPSELTDIDPNTTLGEGATIGYDVSIDGPSVIERDAFIDAHTVVVNSWIGARAIIGEKSRIDHTAVPHDAVLPNGSVRRNR